jgi:hypothetical protein
MVRSFGEIAAEDDDIRRYFVQTPVFQDLMSNAKQVVLGRKGSGKTALYLALVDRAGQQGYFAYGLTFRDYPWALHSKYAYEEGTQYERFLPSWRFLALMQIFKTLLTEERRAERYKDAGAKAALASVEKFIQSNWGVLDFDHKKTFPSAGFRLESVTVDPQFAGYGLGGVSVKRGSGALGETLPRLNEWLWHALKTVSAVAPTVFVLFDELDAGFDAKNADYADRLVGLLLAVRALTRDFQGESMPFRVVAFLRTDIFDGLHFGDKNKLTDSNSVLLAWNQDLAYEGSSLKQLIDQRIREQLSVPARDRDPWGRAFDDEVMRGTQHKFHHMAARSYLRPRDLIKFCNAALDEAKRRMSLGAAPTDLISNDDVTASRRVYSKYFLNELDDEIAPVEREWKDYLEVLRRIGAMRFTGDAFKKAYTATRKRVEFSLTEEEMLAFLYRYSIVGFERAVGGAGLVEHFRYQDEAVRFNPEARGFLVHRGLKEALELREAGEAVDDIA